MYPHYYPLPEYAGLRPEYRYQPYPPPRPDDPARPVQYPHYPPYHF